MKLKSTAVVCLHRVVSFSCCARTAFTLSLCLIELVYLPSFIECNKICLLFRNKENVRRCSERICACLFSLRELCERYLVLPGTLYATATSAFLVAFCRKHRIVLYSWSNFTWEKKLHVLLANNSTTGREPVQPTIGGNSSNSELDVLNALRFFTIS